MNESLQQHVQKITRLPTLPVIAQKILAIVDDDFASVNKLEMIIENDPAISAKILSVANSAFFGFKTATNTLSNAIVRIGFSNVKNIALGISIMTVLGNGKKGSALDYQRIFNHSVSVGFIANLMSRQMKRCNPEEMLMIGMLHDIGFMVLSSFFSDSYRKVLDCFKRDSSLLAAEKEIFDFTHAEIGAWLAEKWDLPAPILNAIRYHHYPSLSESFMEQVAIVHIADFIATQHILSVTSGDPGYPFDVSTLEVLSLDEHAVDELGKQVKNGMLLNGLFGV